MSKSSSLIALACVAVLAAGSACARDYNTQEVSRPPGHEANRIVSLGLGQNTFNELSTGAAQFGLRYQSKHFFTSTEFDYSDLSKEKTDGTWMNVTFKAGLPIHVYPELQVTPYLVYGRPDLQLDDVSMSFQHAGVGALTQARFESVVVGVDLAKSFMLQVDARDAMKRYSPDKRDVTTVRLEADWNFSDRHHLIARYTKQNWVIATGSDEKLSDSTVLVGYAHKIF